MTADKTIDGCCGQGCDNHSNRNINAKEQTTASKTLFSRFIAGYINLVSSMSKAPHVDWTRKV